MRREPGQFDGSRRRSDGQAATAPASPAWQSLAFETEERPEAVVVRPAGEVDLATVSVLWSTLRSAGESGRHVIVALTKITYIDSTGIKVLLDVHRLLQKRARKLMLADPASVVRKVIEITALGKIIPIYASVDEAARALRAEPESTLP